MGNLVLSRKRNESILIGFDKAIKLIDTDPEAAKELLQDIEIVVVEIRGDKSRLGIRGHKDIAIHRREIAEKIRREQQITLPAA